jgi:hypothetical protein
MAGVIDFKKEQKELYQPNTTPSIIDVPEMIFIAIDGKGDPNTSEEYVAAIEVLYGLSCGIKMANKSIMEYVVPPLEGFWNLDGESFQSGVEAIIDKGKFSWIALIRQPDFVIEEVFEAAKIILTKKKPNLDTSKARLIKITEGLCVQVMHTGSYDNEPATIAAMDKYAGNNGYVIDINETRRHHEIYLSDPRKVVPEKLKTVIRHPIKNSEH